MILFDLAVLQAKTKMWKINDDIQRTRSDTGTLLPGKVGTDLKIPVVNIKLHLCILRDAVSRKILDQWFLVVKLKSSLREFYYRHHELVNLNGISVTQMATCTFSLSRSQEKYILSSSFMTYHGIWYYYRIFNTRITPVKQ